MSILEKIRAVRQSLQSGEASSTEERELAEIRHDILEEIRGNIQELSAGRYIFPFHRVAIEVRPRTPAERAAIQTIWIDNGELEAEVRAVLARADCQYDRNVTVETHFRDSAAEPDTGKDFWLTFESASRPAAPALSVEPSPQPATPTCLSVVAGTADPATVNLSAAVTNLGRLREVFDQDGQFVRCNDLAFSEVENGINETVGRTHAHITRQANGRFCLVNTRRNDKNSTAIIRNGRSIPVILLAEPIEPGDVIQLGRARVAVS
jgi:hypothetical protein